MYVVGCSLSCYVQFKNKKICCVFLLRRMRSSSRASRLPAHVVRECECSRAPECSSPRSALIRSLCPPREESHGLQEEEQEPARAEPRVCDPESRGYGVVCGHGGPARAHV